MKKRQFPFYVAPRGRALGARSGRKQLNQVYTSESSRDAEHVYGSDHPDQRSGSRLRWLVSTCLAAAVGLLAIGVAMISAMDRDRGESTMLAYVERSMRQSMAPGAVAATAYLEPLGTKSDRLTPAARGSTTKSFIQDPVQERKAGKDFIVIKPYTRLVARLSSNPSDLGEQIPPFNPFSLYVNAAGATDAGGADNGAAGSVTVAVRDPDAGVLPIRDHLELGQDEVLKIVAKDRDAGLEDAAMEDGGGTLDAAEGDQGPALAEGAANPAPERLPPDTIAIAKNVLDATALPQFDGQEVRVVQAGAGDTLGGILKKNGIDAWQVRAITAAARKIIDSETLTADQEVRIVLAPAGDGALQPMLVTLFSDGHSHLVTVARTASGTFAGSADPLAANLDEQLQDTAANRQHATLYTSLYGQALTQGLPPEMIMRFIRTFAYDTDFRRRVGPGDGFEAFYDIVGDEKSAPGAMPGHPDELLFAALTVGGETRKFYRFRTPDGVVDYYDAQGSNARKFLLRRPVRGENVRFTSGFGMRMHPLLHVMKMHTGVDWAGAAGTPIIAAGNGVIDELGRKGGNGNYIRIRHANGYDTAYSHMLKFASGLAVGSKVAQGDVIGYIGTTGMSSGPHLHFEVLINNTFVDPRTIHVPRERQLNGRQLGDFQKERAHIEELMNRTPATSLADQPGRSG